MDNGRRSDYGVRLNAHLSSYKEDVLGLDEPGYWIRGERRISKPHILPVERATLNLLPVYRDQCAVYLKNNDCRITLHKDFHHLNSSQAMCFNLFFPCCSDGYALMPLLLKVLGLPPGEVKAEFEKVFNRDENTNFDFFLECADGKKVFFETKLSEAGFGKADTKMWEKKYSHKFERFYRTPLSALVDAKWLQPDHFMKHYQILRNISYLGQYPDSTLFFIYPKTNETLRREEPALLEIVEPYLADRVKVIYLENLVEDLLKMEGLMSEAVQNHYRDFKRKYVI